MDSIIGAQQDMRDAYYGGAPGILSSGTARLCAALVALMVNSAAGVLTLIFGGMLIFPVLVVFCKLIGRSGEHHPDNPLAALAVEGTIWMLLSIPVAVGAALTNVNWFFPAMLLVIAGRTLRFLPCMECVSTGFLEQHWRLPELRWWSLNVLSLRALSAVR